MRDEKDRRDRSAGSRRRSAASRRRLLGLLWLSSIVATAWAAEETTPALGMSSDPECTQCHLVWLEDYETDPSGILVPYERGANFENGRAHAESSDLMCYSCHDGYVVDSRVRIRSGFQHPMAGISELVRARPREVPLIEEEQIYCGSCHTPHGPGHPSNEIRIEENAFLRLATRSGPVSLCTLCHEYDTAGGEVGNHPTGNQDYQVPEELTGYHSRSAYEQGGIGCQTCHDVHGARNSQLVILGGNDGTSPTLCTVCHAADYSEQGLGRYSHPVDVHAGLKDPMPQYPNGEVIRLSEGGKVNCQSCHDIHESRVPDKLLRYFAPGSGLCAVCHGDLFKAIERTGHDLRVSAPDAINVSKQTAEQGGICSACHLPHKGRFTFLWSRVARSGRHPIDRLCLSCHALGGLAPKRINPMLSHPSLVDKRLIRAQTDSSDISLSAPIYDEEGRPADRGWVTCTTCHDAHHWRPAGRDDGEPPAARDYRPGEGSLMNSFLRLMSHEQFCKHCHGIWSLWRYRYFHSQVRGKR